MAASVVRGCLIIAYWSSLFCLGADLLGYFGFLFFLSVFGRLNITEVRTFFFVVVCVPFCTAFLALTAVAFALVLTAIHNLDQFHIYEQHNNLQVVVFDVLSFDGMSSWPQ